MCLITLNAPSHLLLASYIMVVGGIRGGAIQTLFYIVFRRTIHIV